MKFRPGATLRAYTGSMEGCFEPELSRMRAAHRNDYKPVGEKFLTDYVAHRAGELQCAENFSTRSRTTKRNWFARQNSANDCAVAAVSDRRRANRAVIDRRYKSA